MIKIKDLKTTISAMQLMFGKDVKVKDVIRKINN